METTSGIGPGRADLDPEVAATLDREAALVRDAVRLVASGRALRVTVASLRLAPAALALVLPFAVEAGVVLEPLWGMGDVLTDIRAHRAP